MTRVWGMLTKLNEENKYMRLVILILAAAVLLEGVMIYRAASNQRIVVIPPKVDSEFWVAGNNFSNSYFEQVGLFLADRLLSVSPENVDYSLTSVMPFITTAPENVKAIKEKYVEIARTIKTNNIYQIFYPLKTTVTGDAITVEGILKRLTGNVYMNEVRTKLKLGYTVKDGRLFITSVEFVEN